MACARQKSVAPEPAAPPTAVAPSASADSARLAAEARERARRDSLQRAESERAMREKRATLEAPLHFEYDRAELTTEARNLLDRKLQILRETPELQLRLTGHTDERGSDEYNLALGQRRAAAAQQYLTSYDIAATRLQVTSMGEESPVCTASEESCWSQNRRVAFAITAGADRLGTPVANR